ncbi:MAG: hypothetical protein ABSE66_09695 [Thermoplasmata archaeon]
MTDNDGRHEGPIVGWKGEPYRSDPIIKCLECGKRHALGEEPKP